MTRRNSLGVVLPDAAPDPRSYDERQLAEPERPAPYIYYEDDACTIWHGDCRDVLPIQGCAIVTDQPFGTGWLRGGKSVGVFEASSEKPAWDVFSLEWVALSGAVFWAAFAPNSQGVAMQQLATARVNWRKTNPRPNGPDTEPVYLWPVFLPDGIEWTGYNGDTPLHPCQKPEALMIWLLRFCDPNWTIVDPFMGSGTTLVAAKRLGRKAIGIERELKYCEVAANRLRQGALTEMFR